MVPDRWVADTNIGRVKLSEPLELGQFALLRQTASHDLEFVEEGRATNVTQDINVLALVKGSERYIFLFDDSRRADTLRTLGRYASNPDLSFTWYDAAVLSQKVRQAGKMQDATENRIQLPKAN